MTAGESRGPASLGLSEEGMWVPDREPASEGADLPSGQFAPAPADRRVVAGLASRRERETLRRLTGARP